MHVPVLDKINSRFVRYLQGGLEHMLQRSVDVSVDKLETVIVSDYIYSLQLPTSLNFIQVEKPDIIIDAAARVGGILANNDNPYPFLMENLQIQNNLIDAAHKNEVQKFVFLGSSCIYPRDCPQPMKEETLLSGYLEPTNEPYAIAKIAGIKLCQSYRRQYGSNFISAMPTNLYGPNDNFDLESSHVLPALIRKFHDAKVEGREEVVIWGTGSPRREFLHVDDLGDACFFLMREFDDESHINIGTGEDLTIRELAEMVAEVVHPGARLVFDRSKPDGTPRKLLDVSRIHDIGWRHSIGLRNGIASSYEWYLDNEDEETNEL